MALYLLVSVVSLVPADEVKAGEDSSASPSIDALAKATVPAPSGSMLLSGGNWEPDRLLFRVARRAPSEDGHGPPLRVWLDGYELGPHVLPEDVNFIDAMEYTPRAFNIVVSNAVAYGAQELGLAVDSADQQDADVVMFISAKDHIDRAPAFWEWTAQRIKQLDAEARQSGRVVETRTRLLPFSIVVELKVGAEVTQSVVLVQYPRTLSAQENFLRSIFGQRTCRHFSAGQLADYQSEPLSLVAEFAASWMPPGSGDIWSGKFSGFLRSAIACEALWTTEGPVACAPDQHIRNIERHILRGLLAGLGYSGFVNEELPARNDGSERAMKVHETNMFRLLVSVTLSRHLAEVGADAVDAEVVRGLEVGQDNLLNRWPNFFGVSKGERVHRFNDIYSRFISTMRQAEFKDTTIDCHF